MTVPAELFEAHYRADGDPFHYEHNRFERTKYRAQLALLREEPYQNAIELACSIGVFTEMLAPSCRRLTALDCSSTALARTRERLAGVSNVAFVEASLPGGVPNEMYDLVVFSEVGYYLSSRDLTTLRDELVRRMARGAHLILAHMTIAFHEYMGHPIPSRFVEVHDAYRSDSRFQHAPTRLRHGRWQRP